MNKAIIKDDDDSGERPSVPMLLGEYPDEQAPGAWPKGTRVRKRRNGCDWTGTVLASRADDQPGYCYWIQRDDQPSKVTISRSEVLERLLR